MGLGGAAAIDGLGRNGGRRGRSDSRSTTIAIQACTLVISHLRRRSTGAPGTRCSPGDDGPSTSLRPPRYAPCASSKAASRRRRSPIIIRLIAATTTSSVSVRCARCAAIATKAHGRSTSAAIAATSATTAIRSILRIRSTHGASQGVVASTTGITPGPYASRPAGGTRSDATFRASTKACGPRWSGGAPRSEGGRSCGGFAFQLAAAKIN
jgi:hypothetical protein